MKTWDRAVSLAGKTSPTRNRCVDLLRATAILVVVLGHWLMAAPWIDGGAFRLASMLSVSPSSQYLSWLLQVMPIFFFVGGYSNGVSWAAAQRDGHSYAEWLGNRLPRLLQPVLVLLVFWAVLGAIAPTFGVPASILHATSQVALIPTWFLAVYALPVILVPLSHAAWVRFGALSFWIPCGLAALTDLAFFAADLTMTGWLNYAFVWPAIHQLGYAWRAGYFKSHWKRVAWCAGGFALLVALVEIGPWPRSLVGIPGEPLSNTTPPKIPLLALAAFHIGAITLFESTLARWLSRPRLWTATVLVNAFIMTIFLWHSTVMMLLFGAGVALGGLGLMDVPGSAGWWGTRVLWVIAFTGVLLLCVAMLSRFERPSELKRVLPAWRQIAGVSLICAGLGVLSLGGVTAATSGDLQLIPLLLPFVGAEIAGFGIAARLWRRMRA